MGCKIHGHVIIMLLIGLSTIYGFMEKYRNVNIFYHHNHIILLKIPNFLGNTFNSVGRVPFSRSQGRGFESHEGHGVVSLSKTLHLHCLIGLVQPDMTEKLSTKKKRELFFSICQVPI